MKRGRSFNWSASGFKSLRVDKSQSINDDDSSSKGKYTCITFDQYCYCCYRL